MLTPLSGSVPNYAATHGSTNYAAPCGWGTAPDDTIAEARQYIPVAGTLKNFRVELSTAPNEGVGQTWSIYLRASGGSFLEIILSSGTTGVDTDTINVGAGEYVYVDIRFSSGDLNPASSTDIRWTADFEASNAGAIIGNVRSGLSTSADRWLGLQGRTTVATGADDSASSVIIPANGTISKLTAACSGITGGSFTLTVQQNGSPTALTVEVSADDSVVEDSINSVSVSAGDTVSIKASPVNSPTGTVLVAWGVKWVPTTSNEAPMMLIANGVNTASAEFAGFAGRQNAVADESDVAALLPAGTLKKFYAVLVTAPSAGKSWTDAISIDGSPSALSLSIADAATSNSDTSTTVAVTAGQEASISITPVSTPTSSNSHKFSFVYVQPVASGPANVKTINGITTANVKTVNGITIASVKTINGIA